MAVTNIRYDQWPYGIHLFDLKAGGQLWSGWNLSSPLWPGGWRIETLTEDYVKDVFFFHLANVVQDVFACFSFSVFKNLKWGSNTGRQHDHGRRGGGHQRGEIWTLRTCFLLLGPIQVCSSSHTLLIYLSKPETYDGGATRLFLSGKYVQVYWLDAFCKFNFKRFHHWYVSWNITKDHIFLTTRIFFQDTLDIKLPQGYALVFQQKGMLHAGLGNLKHMSDIKHMSYIKFTLELGSFKHMSDIKCRCDIKHMSDIKFTLDLVVSNIRMTDIKWLLTK